METLILKDTAEDIKKAGKILKNGGLIAFPTETVYGLGANGLDEAAVSKVYKAKGRPSDNPMILHISEIDEIYGITDELSEDGKKLTEAFWPGPLTVVVKRKEIVPNTTTGGLDTVGVRMPSDKVARALIKAAGVPIAAPSANLSGKPSPTMAEHVIKDMNGRIDGIICGDKCQVGIESTVVSVVGDTPIILRPGKITREDMSKVLGKEVKIDPICGDKCQVGIESTVVSVVGDTPIILRPGKITREDMSKVLGKEVKIDPAIEITEVKDVKDKDFKPMAPGMKYRHYAPDAEMLVIKGDEEKVKDAIAHKKKDLEDQGKKVGVIMFGSENFEKAAHDLFADLRKMDDENVDYIIAGAVKSEGLGYAVMNRMLKSAGYNVIKV